MNLISLNEAAKELGVTIDNLRGAIHRGSLKGFKIGRNYVVDKAEVERYARENLGRRGPKRKS